MNRIIICLFATCVWGHGWAQKYLSEYKRLTDNSIRNYFSPVVFKKLRCYDFVAQAKRNQSPGDLSDGGYEENKKKIINPEFIALVYSLYSKELEYEFNFRIGVDSNMHVYVESGGLPNIPPCVSGKGPCRYIKKQVAIQLAKKDSIQYSDNLLVMMRKPKNSNNYYWIVNGQDKNDIDYSSNPNQGWPQKKDNTRYIDAASGKMLSYEEYQRLNN